MRSNIFDGSSFRVPRAGVGGSPGWVGEEGERGGEISLVENEKVSWFLDFWVPRILGFLVSGFKDSWLPGFKDSKNPLMFLKDIWSILPNFDFMLFDRY